MTVDEFDKTLKKFLFKAQPADKEVLGAELRIEMQPGMISFGGHFILADRTEIPVDIRQVGKAKCRQFTTDIESMHRLTTNSGQDKWNKATFKVDSEGQISRQFVWDEEFEMDNINSYQENEELTRQKWYWEEK